MKKIYYKNHLIKKKLSQIFLKDKKIINIIIQHFNPQKYQTIVEIGSGFGELTQHIITDFLTAIEYDTNLSKKLNYLFDKKSCKIINADVMTVNFNDLFNQTRKKLRIIGNIPYHISTKLLLYLLKYINIIEDIHFMLQKEVADRITAQPNNKKYGRLSIIIQYYYKTIPLFEIPANAFIPQPKVKSTMIQLLPHKNIPYPAIDIRKLSLLTNFAFNQRRKMIKHSLSTLFSESEITKKNIDATLRAENITVKEYCILANMLDDHHVSI